MGVMKDIKERNIILCVREDQHGKPKPSLKDSGKSGWEGVDAELIDICAQLAGAAIPAEVFHARLLAAVQYNQVLDRPEVKTAGDCHSKVLSVREGATLHLGAVWRLHESGLLPLSRLLEMNETSAARSCVGSGVGIGERFEDWSDGFIRSMRVLASEWVQVAASEGHREDTARANKAGVEQSYFNGEPGKKEASTLVADIARHLFDLGYRSSPTSSMNRPIGSNADWIVHAARGPTAQALSSKAAKKVLDQLCCESEMFR